MSNTSTTPPEEQFDVYTLVDCSLLKILFTARKLKTSFPSLSEEEIATLSDIIKPNISRILGELKVKSKLFPFSSLIRLAYLKTQKNEIERYLRESQVDFASRLNCTLEELPKYISLEWTWCEFSLGKLTSSSEIKRKYEQLIAQEMVSLLTRIRTALTETETHTYKLRDKQLIVKDILTPSLNRLMELADSKEDFGALAKELLTFNEIVKGTTEFEKLEGGGRIVRDIERSISNRIVTTKKAPRKVILK